MDSTSAESRYRLRQAINDEINSLEESTRALKFRSNALAPISRLPPEILAVVFSFLFPSAWNKEADHLARMYVAHVCRRWREIALNHPRLWSRINFTKLTPAGAAEILARAKMAPLHLEADITNWSVAQLDAFGKQLEAHIFHTRNLSISGPLQTVLERLVSSAPTLESLFLSHQYGLFESPEAILPVNLFNCTTPRLTTLELESCNFSWKSPLLKGLRDLKILRPCKEAGYMLEGCLDALNEMPQLKTLVLQTATPLASQAAPLISEPSRTITLPSLTRFCITASARDCLLVLAHLVLPALIWIHVDAESLESEGEDVRPIIPFVSRIFHNMQDKDPLRSILISGERTRAEVAAWTMPEADVKVCDPETFFKASVSARLTFAATSDNWRYGVDTMIFDALLTLLPVDPVSTLTVQNDTRLDKEFWLSHAPRWPSLEQARLVPTAVKAFMDMLVEDAPPDGPRLPSLTKLILVDVKLIAPRTYRLCDVLIERVEQGVPLEALDLRTCVVADRSIGLLREIVADVLATRWMVMDRPTVDWHGGIGYYNEVDYGDGRGPWYYDTDDDDDHEVEIE